jgi:predicted nucleic acid-binding protein
LVENQPKKNDISIAALAHQIDAAVLTKNQRDFMVIRVKIDFEFESNALES